MCLPSTCAVHQLCYIGCSQSVYESSLIVCMLQVLREDMYDVSAIYRSRMPWR
jgi:hypothetical protein